MSQQKRRNPWLAGIGNFLFAPTGHVYAGQAWRGVLMYAAIMSISLVALCAFSRTVGKMGLLLMALVLIAAPLCLVVDAVQVARRRGSEYQLKWYNRWYVYLIAAVMAQATAETIVSAIRAYVVEAYYIPSGAMRPTLVINDRIVVDKMAYRWRSPARFDVMVFHAPQQGITGVPVSREENVFIKRVIGLPGDTVQVVPDAVMVDGKRAVQLLDKSNMGPYGSFLSARQHGLGIEKGQAPQIRGNVLAGNNGEPRVVATPTGKAEHREGQLWVDGQQMSYVGGPGGYRTENNLTQFGAEPGVQGVVYYLGKESDPALIVLKGKKLTLSAGYVGVNGQRVKEPYILETPRYEMPAYKVPAGYYFVMGDNRNDSNDSHAWGPLERNRIFGLVRTIWWPGEGDTGVRWERVGRPLN